MRADLRCHRRTHSCARPSTPFLMPPAATIRSQVSHTSAHNFASRSMELAFASQAVGGEAPWPRRSPSTSQVLVPGMFLRPFPGHGSCIDERLQAPCNASDWLSNFGLSWFQKIHTDLSVPDPARHPGGPRTGSTRITHRKPHHDLIHLMPVLTSIMARRTAA